MKAYIRRWRQTKFVEERNEAKCRKGGQEDKIKKVEGPGIVDK